METSAAGSNETNLLTRNGAALDGRRVTNVLVVTTTVRVVDGVHGNTTSTGPAVALDLVLVVGTAGLEQRLVDTATTGDNADRGTSSARHSLLGARGKTDTRGAVIGVADDRGVVARGTGERAAVTRLALDVADNGTLGERAEGEDVADAQHSLLTAVHKLASVHTLGSNKGLGVRLVAVGVTESDTGKGSTTGD